MAGAKLSFFNPFLNGRLEFQEPNCVCNCCPVFASSLCHHVLCQLELIHEALERAGGLNRIQILSLNVFNERHFERELIRDLPNNGGHFSEAGSLRCAPPAFTRNQLKAISNGTND